MSITLDMRVESYDVQPNGNIKISSLFKMLQKAAGDDANKTPLNYFALAEKNMAFVLTKMNVKILDDIKLYDELKIVSHPRKVRGASFPRDYIVYRDGCIVALCRSMWVLLDLDKRTILRPSAVNNIGEIPPSDADEFEIEDVRRIIDKDSLSRTDVLKVNYSHLDMNNHLNNTFYSDFIFNCLNQSHHGSDKGLYLQINYKAEARLGDELVISMKRNDDTSYDFSADNSTTGTTCFSAYVSYSR